MLLEVVASELIHSRKGSDDSKIEKIMSPPTFAKECFHPSPTHQSEFFSKKKDSTFGRTVVFSPSTSLGKLLFS